MIWLFLFFRSFGVTQVSLYLFVDLLVYLFIYSVYYLQGLYLGVYMSVLEVVPRVLMRYPFYISEKLFATTLLHYRCTLFHFLF